MMSRLPHETKQTEYDNNGSNSSAQMYINFSESTQCDPSHYTSFSFPVGMIPYICQSVIEKPSVCFSKTV